MPRISPLTGRRIRHLFRSGHAYDDIAALLATVEPKGLCLDLPALEALDFLRFITGEKSMKKRAIEGGYLPTLRSTYEDADVLAANPHFASFSEVFQNTRNRPRSPHYPRMSDIIQENVHRALTYEIEPGDAAANMVRELAEIMAG